VSKKLTKKELVRSLITIESGYSRGLTLKGVGYKANVQDGILELKVGKPNTTDFVIPNNLFL
jgi:ribosomal protein L6P/L9E|tara:strand:- start:384 stop:569 length:186 start_codon:yes stop_codon:yes gene_type:complete